MGIKWLGKSHRLPVSCKEISCEQVANRLQSRCKQGLRIGIIIFIFFIWGDISSDIPLLSNRPVCALISHVGPVRNHDKSEFQDGDQQHNTGCLQVILALNYFFSPSEAIAVCNIKP